MAQLMRAKTPVQSYLMIFKRLPKESSLQAAVSTALQGVLRSPAHSRDIA
jgi:hypothetical protein